MSVVQLALLENARRLAQTAHPQAEHAFALVLENDAFNVEARHFLARAAMQHGDAELALEHLHIACRVDPTKPALWRSLGISQSALSLWPEAQHSFERCLQLAPNMHAARLHLGKALEHQGQPHAAVKTYLTALSQAQREGLWLNQASTPPWLADDIAHAIELANRGRTEIYRTLLDALLQRFDKSALVRVDACIQGVLGFTNLQAPNPIQKPTFMYFPGLPDSPVFSSEYFPWFAALERHYDAIRDEAMAVLSAPQDLAPFLHLGENDALSDYLGGVQPNWDAYFFYRHGHEFAEHHTACPHTATALQSLPLVQIAEHAPEICFSVLSPDTHILPHYGTSNIRSVVHLPLIVPEHCALRVADQTVVGQAGTCFAFDDTYLHEAWNRSSSTRVILLMDTWNPHLSATERAAMTYVIEQIGQFNR